MKTGKMDTSKMRHMEELGFNQAALLMSQSENLLDIARNFYDTMETSVIRNQIVNVVKNYDLGKVIDVYEIFGGYVNRSFGIMTEKDGQRAEYFVRKYKKGITEKEILFEHSLIDFSIANGLDLAAGLIRTRDGQTYIKDSENAGNEEQDFYFAIYEYLPGEDKYTWDNPTCNDEEYASAAHVMALFHNASRNFDPRGLERVEPKITEFLPTLPPVYREFAQRNLNTKFHTYYLKNIEGILEVINLTVIPAADLTRMPYNPCHNDFHPGNLKFTDNKAVGIFDFDWSKIELRLFDVCLGLTYCCSSWQDELDGVLLLDKCAIFLESYQKKLRELGGLEPLNETEIKVLPVMMAAANLYLINWDVTAYYAGSNLNEYEYTAYLQHNVRLMKWIEAHKEDIAKMAQSLEKGE